MISFNCPACNRPMSTGDFAAGKIVPCPYCTTSVKVPLPSNVHRDEQPTEAIELPELSSDQLGNPRTLIFMLKACGSVLLVCSFIAIAVAIVILLVAFAQRDSKSTLSGAYIGVCGVASLLPGLTAMFMAEMIVLTRLIAYSVSPRRS